MTQLEMQVASDGKVEIPAEVAIAMGWQAGERLTVQVQNGEVRIFSQAQAIHRAQARYCQMQSLPVSTLVRLSPNWLMRGGSHQKYVCIWMR